MDNENDRWSASSVIDPLVSRNCIIPAHINHIKRVAGIDYVGLGAGFDGIN